MRLLATLCLLSSFIISCENEIEPLTQDDSERTAEDYALLTNNPRIITVFRPEPDCEDGDEECLAAAEAAKVAQVETAGEGTEAAGNKAATKTN